MQIMPFDEAKTYRFNPFDLTKVWPHGDYPLVEVGTLTLDRNVTDYHTEMEQAAFQPNNTVPGTGLSPDKMLLARGFSYADAHRARLGVNYQQIPVNRPKVTGAQLLQGRRHAGRQRHRPRLLPELVRRAPRPPTPTPTPSTPSGRPTARWSGPPTRSTPRTTTSARPTPWSTEVMDDAARDRLVDTVVGHPGRPPARRGAAARLRVLAQHRQGASATASRLWRLEKRKG